MADYYPLLARALEALPDRSPALRKAVYDRARGALTAQLRSLDPPVAEADIELERKSLDKAIDRLETEYGDPPAAVEATPPPPPPPPVTPPPPPPSKPDLPEPALPEPANDAKDEGAAQAEPEVSKTIPEAEAPPAKSIEPEPEPAPVEPPPAEFVPFVPPPRKLKETALPTEAPQETEQAEPTTEPAAPTAKPAEALSAPSRRPRIDVVAPKAGRSRMLRNGIVGGVLLAVIGGIGFAAYVLRDQPASLPQGSESEESAQPEQQEQKFADRVGGESAEPPRRAPSAAPPPDVTVAQRAILYEENASDPRGTPKTSQGRVVWRLEPVSGEQGQPLQSAIRALVEYPDLGFSLTMTIRKNLDATLPASHTIELAFASKSPNDDRAVQEVGLPQLKEDQNVRGAQISGLPVRVRDNLFLIGLSNLPSDIERNTALLTQKSWIDIAVKFKSGPRAVLAIDKGAAGTQVVQSAFDQWRE